MDKKLILAVGLLATMTLAGCNWGKPSDEVRMQNQTPTSSESILPDINSPSEKTTYTGNTSDKLTGQDTFTNTGDNTTSMSGSASSGSMSTGTSSTSEPKGENDFSQLPSAE